MTVLDQPLLTDDYGEAVYRGFWTGRLVWASEAVFGGTIIPQVNGVHVDVQGFEPHRKASFILRCEHDANCNTCKHLERVPQKSKGLMVGICKSTPISHPYGFRDKGMILFHPDDFMGMECYESRYAEAKA